MYARAGRWADITSVRSVMVNKGIKKFAATSIVELGDWVHIFHIGDKMSPTI